MHWHQLTMEVGDMQERDVAQRFKLEQLGFAQALLSGYAPKRTAGAANRGCRRNSAEKHVTAVNKRHSTSLRKLVAAKRVAGSMTNSGHAELQPGVLSRQIKLEVAIFLCIR